MENSMNRFMSDTILSSPCFLFLKLLLLTTLANLAHGEQIYVPDELKPWQDWVLQDHKALGCPVAFASVANRNSDARECYWSNGLNVEVGAKVITFQQDWRVYKDAWVTLPGSDALWPSDVSVDGNAAVISQQGAKPAVFLKQGVYQVSGLIPFKSRPSSIPLPLQSGIVTLSIDGEKVARPNLQGNSILLRDSGPLLTEKKLNDSLSLRVYRNIIDGAPIVVTTKVRLSVSGRDREVRLGRFAPNGGEPVTFQSEIPARIEEDGSLRIQISAGEWELNLSTRHNDQEPIFEMQRLSESWPDQEIWSFTPNRDFRSTKISGANSIDPSQAGVPFGWEQLPAYLMDESTNLKIEELVNASELDPITDLRLTKVIWLDFDGEGLTVQDRFSGQVNRATRITAIDGYELGMANLDEEPQLITQMDGNNRGVELRQGNMRLETVSRVDLQANDSPAAIGWQMPVQHLGASLHTPPGWLLLHVGGPDKANQTWFSQWNLWAIFLVLLISGALWRTTGVSGGLLALAAMSLTYHDDFSLGLLLLVFAIFLAISQLGLGSKVHRYIVLIRNLMMLGIMLTTVAYIVDEARMGMYPQLARQGDIYNPGDALRPGQALTSISSPMADSDFSQVASEAMEMKQSRKEKRLMQAAPIKVQNVRSRYGANENIQTGPGIPGWSWNRAQLVWSGPVLTDQNLTLYALSPGEHRVLRLIKVILVLLLVLKLASHCYDFGKFNLPPFLGRSRSVGNSPALFVMAFLGASLLPADSSAAIPDAAILKDLEERLTRQPACTPTCATNRSVSVQVRGNVLEINLVVDAQALTSFPLPVASLGWVPQQIELVGGRVTTRASGSKFESAFHIALEPGQSIVRIRGAIFGDDLQIRFPVRAHNVEVSADGWRAAGLDGTGLRGDLLQLTKNIADEQKVDENNLLPDPMQPYFRVERWLNIDNDWTVTTVVQRIAPASGSVNFQLPLIEGESVFTRGVRVSDNKVEGTILSGQMSVRWESTLEKSSEITLTAGDIRDWAEVWRVSTSPRWHIETAGLKPVLDASVAPSGVLSNVPSWKPWGGESLVLMFTKPKAAEGDVQTIQELRLSHQPGQRISSSDLNIKVTASQAVDFPIDLPAGAVVREFRIDGSVQQLPSGEQVKVPLHPGEQDISIRWESNKGMALLEKTPVPKFASDMSNVIIELAIPRDRWPLLVGGPSIGPALLFWGVVVAIILVASLLGRIPILPVKTWEWMLLGIGMSTISFPGSLVVVFWFFAMAARSEVSIGDSRFRHNFMQILLVLLTIFALYNLLSIIPESLLSSPDMQIVGNGSHSGELYWYQDRAVGDMPTAWLFSLPMWCYRLTMLVWSMWIVFAMLRWARWGWRSFSAGTIWMSSVGESFAPAEEVDQVEEMNEAGKEKQNEDQR